MSLVVRRAVYGKLSADTTLTNLLGAAAPGYTKGIYYGTAPEGAQFPYVVFGKPSGIPTYAFGVGGSAVAYNDDIWMVKAVDHNTTADRADTISARFETLLNDASLSISGETLLYLRRESDIDYPEIRDGETYFHSGSNFRLVARPN